MFSQTGDITTFNETKLYWIKFEFLITLFWIFGFPNNIESTFFSVNWEGESQQSTISLIEIVKFNQT